jgi:hypothetical protein
VPPTSAAIDGDPHEAQPEDHDRDDIPPARPSDRDQLTHRAAVVPDCAGPTIPLPTVSPTVHHPTQKYNAVQPASIVDATGADTGRIEMVEAQHLDRQRRECKATVEGRRDHDDVDDLRGGPARKAGRRARRLGAAEPDASHRPFDAGVGANGARPSVIEDMSGDATTRQEDHIGSGNTASGGGNNPRGRQTGNETCIRCDVCISAAPAFIAASMSRATPVPAMSSVPAPSRRAATAPARERDRLARRDADASRSASPSPDTFGG